MVIGTITVSATVLASLLFLRTAFHNEDLKQAPEPAPWFSRAKAEVAWQLSLKAYCPREAYPDMPFGDFVDSFVYTKTLHWEPYDVTGFIGYMPRLKTIYVVFRGINTRGKISAITLRSDNT